MLLLDLVRSQIPSVVAEVGFQVHPLVLVAFNGAKGAIQHPREDARFLRRPLKQRRALKRCSASGARDVLLFTLDRVSFASIGDAVAEY